MRPCVTIITINYNQVEHTCELLASLEKTTYPNKEIIVVDNGSEENPEQLIRRNFPSVKVIVSPENLGFAGGNNLGIVASHGKYLLFLNNDTEVDPGFLEPLVDMFEANPDAGAASSKILYYNSDETIQYAGSGSIDHFTGRSKRIGWMERDNGQYDDLRETNLAHGAAMMVPRTIIDKVGMMPEFFFLYYEEVDWCESIKKAGYKIFYVPASKVYHKESMSIGKESVLKTYYLTRNRLLYMRRNTSGLKKITWILFFLIFSIPKNALTFTLQRDMDRAKAFWKGLLWNLTHMDNGQKFKLFASTFLW
jgi:GT2 family glycosyltransferase